MASKPKTATAERSDDSEPQRNTGAAMVTYRPLNPTDPNTTRWNGVRFEANVPVALDPAKHFVLLPRSRLVQVDGVARAQEYDERIPMIELAKGNPSFEVEGFPRAKRVIDKKRVVPPPGAEWADTHEAEIDTEAA